MPSAKAKYLKVLRLVLNYDPLKQISTVTSFKPGGKFNSGIITATLLLVIKCPVVCKLRF